MDTLPPGFRQFLIRARRATSAVCRAESGPAESAPRDVHYEEDDGWRYTDSNLGGMRLTGQEIVWKNGPPVWALNYCGRVVGDNFSGEFLAKALRHVTPDAPYRGPIEYQKGPLLYCNMFAGDIAWFYGREEMFASGVSVYECIYHGGAVR